MNLSKTVGSASLVCALIFALASPHQLLAQDVGSLSGYMFGDYYWMASSHDSDIEGRNGFLFRRIYLTHNKDWPVNVSTRLRLEMDHPGNFRGLRQKMVPNVKDAYISWQPGDHALTLGLSGTPTWALVEDVWGYRFLSQTPVDLHALGSSRDLGLSLQGPLTSNGQVEYFLMVGNGEGTSSEVNAGKKFMASLRYDPADNVVLEVYGDWNDKPGIRDWYTGQVFIGYESESFRGGFLFAQQRRQQAQGSLELNLASLFGTLTVSDELALVGRVDRMFDANPLGANIDYTPYSTGAKSVTVQGGLDYQPTDYLHIMPNVHTVFYGPTTGGGAAPGTDIMPRLTFRYSFL